MSNDEYASEGERYWNEEGGRNWVENIERLEAMMTTLSNISLEEAMAETGESVLDVGCGGGVTSRYLAEQVGEDGDVLGVDISPAILDIARQRCRDVNNLVLEEGDAQVMPFEPAGFDLIYSRFGVMFFENPVAAFMNMRKALKNDGRMVFICWRSPEENPWISRPVAAVQSVFPPNPLSVLHAPDPDAPTPFSLADSAKVENILREAGFTDINLETINQYVHLGPIEEAVTTILRGMGPSAEQLKDASPEQITRLENIIRDLVSEYDTGEGVGIPCAAWLVTARH